MDEQNAPRDLQFSPIESSIEKYKAFLESNKDLSNALNEIRENCRKEVHDLLGSKVNEYLTFRQKIRDRGRDIHSVYRPTPEGEKIRSESMRKLSAEACEFINNLGVDSNNVKNVQKKYLAQSQSAIEKTMKIIAAPDAPGTSTEISKLTDSSAWTMKKPPYDSSWGSEFREGFGGTRYMSHHENKLTGEIKCESMMEEYDVDIFGGWSRTDCYSEILIWYQMPADGLIEAWFSLLCLDTPYSGWIGDEVGLSDAYIEQRSACYLGISQPQSGERVFGDYLYSTRFTDGWDLSWSGNVAQPGERKYFQLLYTPRRFAAGEWVLVAIGIHDLHYVRPANMSYDLIMRNHWIVEEVGLYTQP